MFVPPPPQMVARLTIYQGLGRLFIVLDRVCTHAHVNTYAYMKQMPYIGNIKSKHTKLCA
jgi:hypothetical protein